MVLRNRHWLLPVVLAAVNIYICEAAFHAESPHWNSIHGQWISLARIVGLEWFRPAWWRYWGGGAPLEFTYAPLIPFLIAAIARLLHCTPALALNLLTAIVYCAGPLAFYWLSYKLTARAVTSFAAALVWSLSSPIAVLLPDHRFQLASFWTARRLSLAFEWDDLPHMTALTLLPLALVPLCRALRFARWRDHALAALAIAAMMLANAFGGVLAAFLVLTVPLALERRLAPRLFARALLIAAAGYLIASPWLPPSLIATIRANAARDGEAGWSLHSAIALVLVTILLYTAWRVSGRLASPARWTILMAALVISISALGEFHLSFVPQSGRYKIEAELAIVWISVFALAAIANRIPAPLRVAALLPLLALAARQVVADHDIATNLCRPVNLQSSIEYRAAQWVAQNLPGERVMMAGSLGNFMNAFTGQEQLSAQPYTTAPNWEEQIAVYTIYIGENAGEYDGEYSLLWLKAFGAQAVAVPGPQSPEYWKPFIRPGKFDPLLPVLWREEDTTIYRIPQRSHSLAHVLPRDRLVSAKPVHGLDLAGVRRYAAALDSETAPARFDWVDPNRATIHATLASDDTVSVQINYHPGWRAHVRGAPASLRPDGIGLIAIDPGCTGECEITLQYDGGWESYICRLASVATLLLSAIGVLARPRNNASPSL